MPYEANGPYRRLRESKVDMLQVDKTTKQKAEKSPPRVRAFVGYIRVSTKRQAELGLSLEAQSDMLRAYANSVRGGELIRIFEDPVTGHRVSRDGLLDAIKEATSSGASLLVPSVDRLSRNVEVLKLLDVSGLTVVCANKGRISKLALKALVVRAQRELDEIAARSAKSAADRKTRSGGVPHKTTLNASLQRRGTLANLARADQRMMSVADYIAANPSVEALSWNERVRTLNAAGLLNLKSATRNEFVPWTYGALRRVWTVALAELVFRREMDAEEMGNVRI